MQHETRVSDLIASSRKWHLPISGTIVTIGLLVLLPYIHP